MLFTKKNIIIAIIALAAITVGVALGIILPRVLGDDGEFDRELDLNALGASWYLPTPTDGSTPADHTPSENAYYAFYYMRELDSFTTKSSGSAITKVGISVEQIIKAERVINGSEVYKESLSHSTFKSVGGRNYIKGDGYVVLSADSLKSIDSVSWASDAEHVSQRDFIATFGYVPNGVTGYVINDDTIISAEYLGEEGGIYSFKYVLDNDKATGAMSLEMRTMAGNDSLPVFEYTSIIIRMDENWCVTETVTDCIYRVNMLGGVTCHETLTEVFSDYNAGVEVPNADFFRQYIDDDITELPPVEKVALDYLLDGFTPYLMGGEPLKIAISVLGEEIPVSANGWAEISLSMTNLDSVAVKAFFDSIEYDGIVIEDLFVAYADGMIYVRSGEIAVYASVDEISEILAPMLPAGADTGIGSLGLDLEAIVASAVLTEGEGCATVDIPLSLNGLTADVTLSFKAEDEIVFEGAVANIGGVSLDLDVDASASLPEIGEGYYCISSLADIIDENGNISFLADISGQSVDLTFNLQELSLYAKTELLGETLYARIEDGTVYLSYKGLCVYMPLDEIDTATKALRPVIGDATLPEISTSDVKSVIEAIEIEDTDLGVTVKINVFGISAEISLDKNENELSLAGISAKAMGLDLTLTPAEAFDTTEMPIHGYHNILPLLSLIDSEGRISLDVVIDDVTVSLTYDIPEAALYASVLGIEVKLDVASGDAFIRYGEIRAKCNVSSLGDLINEILPIANAITGGTSLPDMSGLAELTPAEILDLITIINGDDRVAIYLEYEDISATVFFDDNGEGLILESVTVNALGVVASATPRSEAVYADFDYSADYVEIDKLAKHFAPAVLDVVESSDISITLSGRILVDGVVYEISQCRIDIADIRGAARANATLTLLINKAGEGGVVTTQQIDIRLVYHDPSLVEEGAPNVYFTFDDARDSAVMEGRFTTSKADETLDIVKQIFKNIPELREALSFIPTDESGEPTLPEFDIDVASLIKSLSFADGTLAAGLNGNALADGLGDVGLTLTVGGEGELVIGISEAVFEEITVLYLGASVKAEDDIADEVFDYSASKNASDFSSINELLLTLSNTSAQRSFHITGDVDMNAISLVNIKDKVHLDVKIDVIDGKSYVVAEIRRDFVALAWNDHHGTATLYYDPVNEMIYIKDVSTAKRFEIFEGNTTTKYYSYTLEEFTADMMTPLMNMLHFSDGIMDMIPDSGSSDATADLSGVTIESVFKGYSYNGSDTFNISLNMSPIVEAIREVSVDIGHDSDMNVNSLAASADISGALTVQLNAFVEQPYNTYQGTVETIAAEVSSGKYPAK